jgi:hypothetical protein
MPIILTPKEDHFLLGIRPAFGKDNFRILFKLKKLQKLRKSALFDPEDIRHS